MIPAIEHIDYYQHTHHLHLLTANELHIPALRVFGKQNRKNATESLPPHFHKNCFEITYISTGSAIFAIDGTNYKLSGGDIFLTLPNQIHSTNSIPISVCEMYWFQIEAAPEHFLFLNKTAASHLIESLSLFDTPQLRTGNTEIYRLIKSAFSLCEQGSNPQMASQYLSLVLYKLIELKNESSFNITPDIGQALNYIKEHITEELSLEQLADISHLSVSQFKQKFKNQIGVAPRQFINSEKIESAKELLLNGYSVTDVASMLGFDNSSYFAVVFKRFNMCSPTEYVRRKTETDGK